MQNIKIKRALTLARIAGMPMTCKHITDQLAPEWSELRSLTSKQLGAVMRTIQRVYHEGRKSTGACVEDDAVWVGAGVEKLIPLQALRSMQIVTTTEPWKPASAHWPAQNWQITSYKMDFVERV